MTRFYLNEFETSFSKMKKNNNFFFFLFVCLKRASTYISVLMTLIDSIYVDDLINASTTDALEEKKKNNRTTTTIYDNIIIILYNTPSFYTREKLLLFFNIIIKWKSMRKICCIATKNKDIMKYRVASTGQQRPPNQKIAPPGKKRQGKARAVRVAGAWDTNRTITITKKGHPTPVPRANWQGTTLIKPSTDSMKNVTNISKTRTNITKGAKAIFKKKKIFFFNSSSSIFFIVMIEEFIHSYFTLRKYIRELIWGWFAIELIFFNCQRLRSCHLKLFFFNSFFWNAIFFMKNF